MIAWCLGQGSIDSSSWTINRATSMPLQPSPALVSTREGIDNLFGSSRPLYRPILYSPQYMPGIQKMTRTRRFCQSGSETVDENLAHRQGKCLGKLDSSCRLISHPPLEHISRGLLPLFTQSAYKGCSGKLDGPG